ncbi:3-deoxy-D-manno-octulosonate cytidylyltransferase [Helicobacter valdiviensis]|uniref:3-deoxy-D-manno-octulosonate cytidylyltransferase n=1 Tax=Helicobacter valdiviensis TaxID=1458358 RepID=A0A2W6MUG4_9HELI|nr:3-deoxy-manno-octulosonate cytidylyltransferase [Helicobacter valdiviensis]PZT48154.1 3-deoxy-D-manno-octulosonate cytidylyltransferase [Helicobacter valdiviensis]
MIIVPARLKSTRFPNKVLEDIGGIPMIIRVANIAKKVDDVVIATDEEEVKEVCKKYNIQAILTSKTHNSGTDRVAECARILKLPQNELVINMQGDEPFLEVEVILALKKIMQEKSIGGKLPFMGTCIKEISSQEAQNPNLVKAIFNKEMEAIYFSRSLIPYDRENFMQENHISYYGHLGIYAFSNASLQEFCTLPKSNLEEIEKLEQLRAIENKKTIVVAKVQSASFGIDTQEDLIKAKKIFL